MSKVLITDFVHSHLIQGLEHLGYQVEYRKDHSLEETKAVIHEYEGIIINSKTVMDKGMLDKATQLKFIGRLGSGLEIIDLAYAKLKNVQVYNSPEGNRNAVAEHALGMLLGLSNKLIKGNREVKDFIWKREENRGFELEGKVIGIIGFGNTGTSFAKVLRGFDVEILAYDKYKKNYTSGYDQVKESNLPEILEKADVISLHLPLTKETHLMVDEQFLKKVKKGTVIVNTSRGKVVDTMALIQALENDQLKGACLDVFENEKTNFYTQEEIAMYKSLFVNEQVIVSPHVAGWTNESLYKIADTLLKKIKNIS